MVESVSKYPEYHNNCERCGYSPLHYKTDLYSKNIVTNYKCAICGYTFQTKHEYRDQDWKSKI